MEKELIQQQILLEFYPKTSFTIICKGRVVSISFEVITHVSKYGNETVIYTKGRSYRTYNSLQEILNDLPVNEFFRVHRSHIVSLRVMNGIKRKRIRAGEYYLPVSRYYRVQLLSRLGSILDREFIFYETNTVKALRTYESGL